MENNLIPKLRFPEFSNSWEIKILEKIAKRGTGHTPDKNHTEYYNGGIKWISLADSNKLDNGKIYNTKFNISELGIKKSSAVIHPKNTVLLSRDAGVGKSAIMSESMAVSQHFVTWFGKNNELDNYFLYYKLQILKPVFEKIAVGNTIKTIGMPFFKNLKITIPEYSEQQKIATFLTSVDERLTLLAQQKEKLELYKKGLMQQIFSQKLRFKDENGKEYPDWEEKKLGEICEKKSSNISANTLEKNHGEFKIYGATGFLKKVDFYQEQNEYISIVKDGAGVGRILLCEAKSSVLGTLDKIFPKLKIDIYFLFTTLENIDYTKYSTGSTIPHIYFKDYSKEKIKIPCLEEQQKIASFLSAIDVQIEGVSKKIEQTKLFKKGLLQQMFV